MKKEKRFNEKYTISTKKHLPSQMIWGGGTQRNGSIGLYFFPSGTTINGKKYLELLKDKLKIHIDIHQFRIFMYDDAHATGLELYLIF